jgi:multiple sugar transport system permease protein
MTLPRGLSTMIMGDVYLWGPMMAAALAASLPLVIFYMYFQKFLVQGVTAGSVKG